MAKIFLVKPAESMPSGLKIQPLGLLYLASALRKSNRSHHISLLDMTTRRIGVDEAATVILKAKPSIVGFSCMTIDYGVASKIAEKLKQLLPDIHIVIGGPHASSNPVEILANPSVDYLVMGEGEETFTELVETLEKKGDPSEVKGIAFMKDGKEVRTSVRPAISNLDKLAFPAWDLLDFERYFNIPFAYRMLLAQRRFMAIFTSRGCPYRCTYCHSLFGKKARLRSPENMLAEIELLYRKHNIRNFIIIDDIFNISVPRAEKFCDLVINSKMKIKLAFLGGFRGDLVKEPLISKLKKAGTYSIAYAVETSSLRLQKVIKKNAKVAKLKEVIALTNKAGIFTSGFFMFGLPTETMEEVKDTIKYAASSKLNMASFMVLQPIVGTEVYLELIQEGFKVDMKHDEVNCFKPTTVTNQITVNQLNRAVLIANLKFLLNPRRFVNTWLRLPKKRHIFSFLAFYWRRFQHLRKIPV